MKTPTLRSWTAALALLLPLATLAQTPGVGIGTTGAPDASAALEVKSTSQGLLPPRLTQAQRDAIASPAAGLTVFNTSKGKLNTWNGTSWDEALTTTEYAAGPTSGPLEFYYTGAPQTFTVPANTYSLTVDAWGCAGGEGYHPDTGEFTPGGQGARVQATLAVVPGQVLTLYVGSQGGTDSGGNYMMFGRGGMTLLCHSAALVSGVALGDYCFSVN